MPVQKRAFLIHGWDSHPEDGILPWLKKELRDRGFLTRSPAMPEPLTPEIGSWVRTLNEEVGTPDENMFFFGHSIGVQTILRYLESLPADARVGGAVFLAGWTHLTDKAYEVQEDREVAKPWLETPLDWGKITSHRANFVAIFSDNDSLVPLSEAKIFEDTLGARIIIEHGKGHFTGSSGIRKLPSALEAMLKIAGEAR